MITVFQANLPSSCRFFHRTLKILFLVAATDGELALPERVILQYFADKLGVSQPRFDEILAAAEREAKSLAKSTAKGAAKDTPG